jgi:hypothetical protein
MKTINLEIALKWWSTLDNSQKAIINDEFDKGMRHYCELEDEDVLELYKFQCEQAYNETFNPEAHSSLIIDFDAVETIEEVAHKHDKYMLGQVQDSGFAYNVYNFITGAKSNAARNYWFKIFNEEQKGQFKQEKS